MSTYLISLRVLPGEYVPGRRSSGVAWNLGESVMSLRADSERSIPMPNYFAVLTIILMLGLVLTRVFMMKRRGVEAMHFGKTDKTDFLIPPFALLYFYLVFAAAFQWPTLSTHEFFHSEVIRWVGVLLCLARLLLLLASLVSFGKSFRVGIDTNHPDKLITTGIFALIRNPIYVAFACLLLGQFLIFSNWILLAHGSLKSGQG